MQLGWRAWDVDISIASGKVEGAVSANNIEDVSDSGKPVTRNAAMYFGPQAAGSRQADKGYLGISMNYGPTVYYDYEYDK